jgi:uncharacterized membrane protein
LWEITSILRGSSAAWNHNFNLIGVSLTMPFIMPNWQFVEIIAPDDLVREAQTWVSGGVQVLGGCCGLGPQHVSALTKAFA